MYLRTYRYACVRVIFPVTRTLVHTHAHTVHEWTLLIVTSERDNQIVVSVTQRIYKTENSTDQFETGVSKHFFPFMKEKNALFAP